MRWSDSPLVRIGRDGDWFVLGRDPEASPALHLWGSEGLGLAPVDIAKSDRITSDGSIVRGVRLADREVFLPLLLEADSMLELNEIRERMYDLMAPDLGPVEIQLEIPTGEGQEPKLRSIFGYLTDGLDGKFGEDYYGSWQKVGLTFSCPDPWWLGPEKTQTLQINPGVKPFLDSGEVVYARRNLAVNPRFDTLDGQLGTGTIASGGGATLAISTDWSSSGGTSLKVTDTGSGDANARLMPYDAAGRRGAEFAGKTITVSLDMHIPEVQSTTNNRARTVGIGYVQADGTATTPAPNWSAQAPNTVGTHRVSHTVTLDADILGIYVFARTGGTAYVDSLLIEEGETSGEYFDGDTEGAYWAGDTGRSESFILAPGSATPFLPVILAESFAQGEWQINVGGDSDVWPTWEITGPGTDLIIKRGDERIYMAGTFPAGSPVRIATEYGRITPDRWADVSLDSRMFPLRAGANNLNVTLGNATTATTVRLVWRERYRKAI